MVENKEGIEMKMRKGLTILLVIATICLLSTVQAMAMERGVIISANGNDALTVKCSDALTEETLEDGTPFYTLAADSRISVELSENCGLYAVVQILTLDDTGMVDFDAGILYLAPEQDFYKSEIIFTRDGSVLDNLTEDTRIKIILHPGDKTHIVMGESLSRSQATQDMLSKGFMPKISLVEDTYYAISVALFRGNDSHFEAPFYFMIEGEPAKEQQAPAPAVTPVTATPTSASVLVNGKPVAFDAYLIGGNNYFKLRDIAMALNGSTKQFQVGWDAANNAISLTGGEAYTAVGGELASGAAGSKSTTPSTAKIYLDGKEVQLTAYTIHGNNYVKLRDLGATFDFGVGWDAASNTIAIDSSIGYTE